MSVRLSKEGHNVIGVDSLNDYYDVQLKLDRLKQLEAFNNFKFYNVDISEKDKFHEVFSNHAIDVVINLAAQAGVRYSIINPYQYISSNIVGFMNVLEACRNFKIKHLVFASSSSVYGANTKIPFSTNDHTDHPVSLYAATKKSNEAMAHSYSALYNIPITGLRFFTVYGPWGRPDMAYFLFTRKIINNEPIELFNYGNMKRDFTYVDDIVNTIDKLIDIPPTASPDKKGTDLDIADSFAPYKIYNIGNHQPVELREFVSVLEDLIGRKAVIQNMPMQQGDMLETYADIDDLTRMVGFAPHTNIREGLQQFVDWYKLYYGIK